MATQDKTRYKKVTSESILQFVRNHEEPVVTAGEIADEFDMTNQGVNYRLRQLEEEGKLVSKTAGSSAKVWYCADFQRAD